MSTKKKRPCQRDEATEILNQVKEYVTFHSVGNVVNLSKNSILKKQLADNWSDNWDAKKKRKVYMKYNGFMSFVYHYITTENGITIAASNHVLTVKLIQYVMKDTKLSWEEEQGFCKLFEPVLDGLFNQCAVFTADGFAAYMRNLPVENENRKTFLEMDASYTPALLDILTKLFDPSLSFLKEKTFGDISWELASWLTCHTKHPHVFDLIIHDPPQSYRNPEYALIENLKAANRTDPKDILTSFQNKRMKES